MTASRQHLAVKIIVCSALGAMAPSVLALNHAARQMGARERLWSKGIMGDPNSAIAIFDTGIDPNHAGFGNGYSNNGDWSRKIVYWFDAYGGKLGYPNDRFTSLGSGHGTHAAGMAASGGFASVDSEGRVVNTNAYQTALDGEYPEQTSMLVEKTGTLRIDLAFDSDDGAIESARLLFGNREIAFDGNSSERRVLDGGVTVATMTGLRGTPGLKRIKAENAGSVVWNPLEYRITDPSQFGVYTLVTKRRISAGGGLGSAMRFQYIARWPARVDAQGNDERDGLPYYAGMAPNSKLAVVQATSAFDLMDSLKAMRDDLTTHHVVVANVSAASSSFVEKPFADLLDRGILTVAAVGNEGPGRSIGKPAAFRSTIAVGGITPGELLAWYPNSGSEMDLLAPGGSHLSGGGIVSVHNGEGNFMGAWGFDVVPNDGLGMQGSSMATPAAAGAAALVYDALGGWDGYLDNAEFSLNGKRLTRREKALHVKRLLCMTATELNTKRETAKSTFLPEARNPILNRGYDPARDAAEQNYGKDPHEGFGRINVDAAADAALLSIAKGAREDVDLVSSRAAWSSTQTTSWGTWNGVFSIPKVEAPKSWARYIDISSDMVASQARFELSLTNPAGADFDLFVYQPEMGPWGEPLLLARSVNENIGASERISFVPNAAGRYYVVVKAVSGEGSATLSVE
jgi:subtilisin family serine protease